jgi:hypothetical protein
VAVLLVQTTPADAQQEDGAMAVDCEGNTLELDVECQFGDGQEFTVGVQVISPPDGGYSAFQTNLRWDSDVLTYRPSDPPGSEAVWERCTIPVRAESLETVLFGCVPFPIDSTDPDTYEDVGTVLLFTFACSGQGTSALALVPHEGASVLDTYFLVPPGYLSDPTLAAASVTCSGAAVARPEPEVTTGVEGLSPEGDIVPPDEQVSSVDASATLALNPDLGRPQGEAAGDDDDGGAWVWIVITVGALIAVSALGLIFGRRRRSES